MSRLVSLFVRYGRTGSSLFLFVFTSAGVGRSMFFRAFFTFRTFFRLGFRFAFGLFSLIGVLVFCVFFVCFFIGLLRRRLRRLFLTLPSISLDSLLRRIRNARNQIVNSCPSRTAFNATGFTGLLEIGRELFIAGARFFLEELQDRRGLRLQN